MNDLKVAVLPLNITWADIDENLYATSKLLSKVDKDTDIVVLPELFTTGFINTETLLEKYSEPADKSMSIKQLSLWAEKYNFAIAGTFLVKEEGKFYNRAFFVEPSGECTFYDKKHLFGLSTEATQFTSGIKPIPVIRYRGWNIAMAICYELRFPAWLRNVSAKYDVLIIPAAWPSSRAYAWEHLLIARAIENQAYVVGANRSGQDDDGHYDDMVHVFNYLGKPLTPMKSDISTGSRSGIVYAEFKHDKLQNYRKKFPVLREIDIITLG